MSDSPGSVPENLHPEVAEAIDATKPATPEIKKGILSLIDKKLQGEGSILFKDGHKGADLIVEETNTPVSIDRRNSTEKRTDGLIAIVTVIDRINGKTGGPRNITNYHFKEAPDELSVEKLQHFDENEPYIEKTAEEGRRSALEGLARFQLMMKSIAEEREAGLTFFSQQDAIDLKSLLTNAVSKRRSVK